MTAITLERLIEGRAAIEAPMKARIDHTKKMLQEGKAVTEEDTDWLDGGANLVDEDRAIGSLRNSCDIARDLHLLDSGQHAAVDRMMKA